MYKKLLVLFALLLVLTAGIAFFLSKKPAVAPTKPSALVTPATGFDEHADYYDITTDYATSTPLLATLGATADASARSTMLGFVTDTIAAFKSNGKFDSLTAEDIKTMGFDQSRKESLDITFKTASGPRTISYIFTVYEDTLGAHGNTFFKTFTFDMTTGALLSLSDVFGASDYLTTLSSISRAKLPGVIGEFAEADFIKAGTTPVADNFSNFYFEGTNFVLAFPPYAVAPYAAGPQTLRIPRATLATSLRAEYR